MSDNIVYCVAIAKAAYKSHFELFTCGIPMNYVQTLHILLLAQNTLDYYFYIFNLPWTFFPSHFSFE